VLEADVKRGLKKRLLKIPGSIVLRHEDQFAGGRADFSVHVPPRCVWIEVKYERPDSSGRVRGPEATALQRQFLIDHDGYLATYRTERDGSGSVRVTRPRYPDYAVTSTTGLDHEFVRAVAEGHLTADVHPFDLVSAFHKKFGLPRPGQPTPSWETARTRADHLAEEVRELRDAIETRDLVEVADALADIDYLSIGTAVNLGLPWAEVFAEVHRSNMEKERAVGAPGQSTSKQGIVKPAGWTPPDVAAVLLRAGWKEAA